MRSPTDDDSALGWLSLPHVRYPNAYLWFVFFAALDVMLTWAILSRGGDEVNPVAAVVIDAWGLPGAVGFKFGLMLLVVIACEEVGRRRDRSGRWLAIAAVAISSIPVAYSLGLLIWHTFWPA